MFDDRPPAPRPDDPPPPAARSVQPKRGHDGLALLLIGALIGGAVGIGGARALTPHLLSSGVASAPAARSTSRPTNDTAAKAAIKDVLQRANQAQAAALAKNDPSPMRATSTDSHYAQMVQINRDLANGGVTRIALLNITFGHITVSGATATATTTETWRSTYVDGTTTQSTDVNDYALVRQNGTWKIVSNTQPGNAGVTAPTPPQVPLGTAVRSISRNWSGYVADGGTSYTAVGGTWVVPKPDPTVPGNDATWVGIGGASSTDLIQAGTEATVNGDGTVSYDAWTETLPQSTRTISLAVKAGDTVSVALTERSSGLWLVGMKNLTTGKSFSATLRYRSSKSSAEWIEEAPSVGPGLSPLDSFGAVRFTAAGTVVDGGQRTLTGAGAREVTMADALGRPLAVPSTIGGDGSSFTVTRTSTPGTDLGTGGRFPGRRRG